ncbi:MAG TPA: protein kinase [Opitutales bacterium]|nr:protein kinase [Opitutales bacterium]
MGVVYKARQKSLDRWVAIKLLAPERVSDERFAEHFEREAKTLAKMSHSNIVTVFDHGETDGLYFIVMEYIDGVNLRDLLSEGKMEPEQALAIVPPICEALEYAHDKGVVHRDIKPENLLLDRDGRIKIADFGIASLVGASGEKSGTPPYMAPEQSGGTVDRRADIYALGAVLYEMLTGERPDEELVAPSKRVEVDVKIDEMVLRALEKEPERRYQTAVEFRTMAEVLATRSKTNSTTQSKPKGNFWKVFCPSSWDRALVFGVRLFLLGILGYYFWPQASPPQYSHSPDTPRPSEIFPAKVWDAIELFGVMPNGGSKIYDANGHRIGEGPPVGPWDWSEEKQATALIFEIPEDVTLDWHRSLKIRESETGKPLGLVFGVRTSNYLGKSRRIQTMSVDRTYERKTRFGGSDQVPIEKIDITLQYYLPGQGRATCTFRGPFELQQSVKAEEGGVGVIRPGFGENGSSAVPWYHLTAFGVTKDRSDYQPIFIYDKAGNRYPIFGKSPDISGDGETRNVELKFWFDKLPPNEISAITFGEKGQQKTFRDICIQPQYRLDHPPYIDVMASALGLDAMSYKQLQDYTFTDVDEAIRVIDIVHGHHFHKAWQKIEGKDFASFSSEQQQKLRRVARSWLGQDSAFGIGLGLRGQWPEFVEPAFQRLRQPLANYDRNIIILALRNHYKNFDPEELMEIAKILENSDDLLDLYALLLVLEMNSDRPGGREALMHLARSEKVWLWWPAIKRLNMDRELMFGQMDRELQVKYLAQFGSERGLDRELIFRARMRLANSLSAHLALISGETSRDVLRTVIDDLPRVEAEAVLLDLLEDILKHWSDPKFLENSSRGMDLAVRWVVRQLNIWHDLNLGGITADGHRQGLVQGIDGYQVAREALSYFGRDFPASLDAAASADYPSREITLTLKNLLGEPLANAELDLRPFGFYRFSSPRIPLAEGPRIRAQTNDKGEVRIAWPNGVDGKSVHGFMGTVSHPEYGLASTWLRRKSSPQTVAMAPRDSIAYENSLWGQVVSESGQVIPGASVKAWHRTADGKSISALGGAVTDSTGRFQLPFAPEKENGDVQRFPDEATYGAVARSPLDEGLFPTRVKGTSPVAIVLREPDLPPRRLRFELGENEYAGEEELVNVRLIWEPFEQPDGKIRLSSFFTSGEPVGLMPGIYHAHYSHSQGRRFDYLPVEVDAGSPEQITFTRPPPVRCSGRVGDGVNGRPLSGAFVILYTATKHPNLAMLTDEEWAVLEEMPLNPSREDPGLEILKEHYSVEAIARTDANGRYTILRGRESRAFKMLFFARHRLPYELSLRNLNAEDGLEIKAPSVSLFPAGYVQFVPHVPAGHYPYVYTRWELMPKDAPDWLDKFKAEEKHMITRDWLNLRMPVRTFVPAGLRFKMGFGSSSSNQVRPVPPNDIIRLAPGETVDLGTPEFVEPESKAGKEYE